MLASRSEPTDHLLRKKITVSRGQKRSAARLQQRLKRWLVSCATISSLLLSLIRAARAGRPLRRKTGPKVWEFLCWETDAGGKRVRKQTVLGNLENLPTKRQLKRKLTNCGCESIQSVTRRRCYALGPWPATIKRWVGSRPTHLLELTINGLPSTTGARLAFGNRCRAHAGPRGDGRTNQDAAPRQQVEQGRIENFDL